MKHEDFLKAKEWSDLELLKAIARMLNNDLGLQPPINTETEDKKYLKAKIIYALGLII